MPGSNFSVRLGVVAKDLLSGPMGAMKRSVGDLSGAYRNQAKELNKLTRDKALIQKFKKQKDITKELENGWKEAARKASMLAARMNMTGDKSRKLTSEFERLKAESARLKAKFERSRMATSSLSLQLREAGVNTSRLSIEQRRLDVQTQRVTRTLNAQGRSLDQLRERQQSLAASRARFNRSMESTADMSLVGGSIADTGRTILTAALNPIEVAAGIEAAASRVEAKALSGIKDPAERAKQLEKLTSLAENLGSTTTFSTSEVLGAQEELAMAGFSSKDILSSTSGLLDLAKAGALDLGDATSIASGILNQFGLEAEDIGVVSDTLASVATGAATNVTELGEAFKFSGAVAKTAGVRLNQLAGMSKVLADSAITASQAGTSLRSIISRLSAPPKMAAEQIEKLKLNLKGLSVEEKLIAIAQKMKTLGKEEKIQAAKAIAGAEAMAGFVSIMNVAAETTEDGTNALTALSDQFSDVKGAAKTMGDIMSKNLKGQLKGLSSAMEGLWNVIGKLLLPVAKAFIFFLTQLVRAVTWVADVAWPATAILGIMALGFGAVLTVSAGLISTWVALKGTMAALTFGLNLLTAGAFAGASAMKILKIAMIGSGVGALVVGLSVGLFAVYENWGLIKTKAQEFFDYIKPALKTLAKMVFPFFGVFDFFSDADKNPIENVSANLEAQAPGGVVINSPVNFNMEDDKRMSEIVEKKMGEAKVEIDDFRKAMWDSQ